MKTHIHSVLYCCILAAILTVIPLNCAYSGFYSDGYEPSAGNDPTTISLTSPQGHLITLTDNDPVGPVNQSAVPAIIDNGPTPTDPALPATVLFPVAQPLGAGGPGNIQLIRSGNQGIQGSMVLPDLDPGVAIDGFTARFDYTTPNIQNGILTTPFSQRGLGLGFVFGDFADPVAGFDRRGPLDLTGLVVEYDIVGISAGGDTEDAIRIFSVIDGVPVLLADEPAVAGPGAIGSHYETLINLDNPSGLPGGFQLDVYLNSNTANGFVTTPLLTDVPLPGFAPAAGWRFGIGAGADEDTARILVGSLAIATPEPATVVLLSMGIGMLALTRPRRG
jgi:hypothetical protein